VIDIFLYFLETFLAKLAGAIHGIRRSVRKSIKSLKKPIRLDLGSGRSKPPGFVGIDLLLQPRIDLIHNLEEGLPFPADSLTEIRASHVLEHLPHRLAPRLLNECYRVLIPGGKITIKVPDLQKVLEGFLNLPEQKRWDTAWEWIFGSQKREGQFHKTGFTRTRLAGLLKEVGFQEITIENYRTGYKTSLNATAIKSKSYTQDPNRL
jgi:predicted SAM-dependent methyltransferase